MSEISHRTRDTTARMHDVF